MAEETVVQEIPIGTVDMATFKQAREDGVLTVPQKAAVVEEETETEDGSEAIDSDKKELQSAKPKSKIDKRIDRLIKERSIEKERADAAELKLKEWESKQVQPVEEEHKVEPEKVETKRSATDPPRETDYKSTEDFFAAAEKHLEENAPLEENFPNKGKYLEAVANYIDAKKYMTFRHNMVKTFNQKIAGATLRYPDYDELAQKVSGGIHDAVLHAVVGLPKSECVDLFYFMLSHPDKVAELNEAAEKDPETAAKMARDMSARLGKEDSQENNKDEDSEASPKLEDKTPRNSEGKFVSKAPAPIKPVGGGSTKSSVPLDQMSPTDYRKARKEGRVQ